ncbi:uncharacterized protein V1518DRAFT_443977 [Limtongia smithiae]|uniref:uncharacterized protein n=1 Tax=Limtongia smithiae TaxID=1125753 RepID=UPI0034CD4C7E
MSTSAVQGSPQDECEISSASVYSRPSFAPSLQDSATSSNHVSYMELQQQLAALDLELEEGDVTEKGYRKRRAYLLEYYGQHAEEPYAPFPADGNYGLFNPSQTDVNTDQYNASPISSEPQNEFQHSPLPRPESTTSQPISEKLAADHDYALFMKQTAESVYSSQYVSEYYTNARTQPSSTYELKGELQKPLEPRDIFETNFDPHNGNIPMAKFDNLAAILRHRGRSIGKLTAIYTLDNKGKEVSAITWEKLASRAEKVAQVIRDKSGLYRGDRVTLLYREHEVIDFVVALLGCFLAGVVAVPINTVSKFKDINYILNYTQSHLALTTDTNLKTFHRDFSAQGETWPRGVEWWKTNEFGSYHPPSKKSEPPALQVPDLAYIEYSRAPTGEFRGVVMSHKTVMHQMSCVSAILSSKSKQRRRTSMGGTLTRDGGRIIDHIGTSHQTVISYLDPRQSIGMIIGVLMTVYAGNSLVWVPQSALSTAGLYAHIISRHKPSIVLADYPGLKQVAYNYQRFPLATRNFSRKYAVDFSSIKWCLIDCLTVDPDFHEILVDRWLRPLGNKSAQDVVAPMLTLSEHGGMVIAMRDWLGGQESLGCHMPEVSADEELSGPSDLSELLLDKKALSTNNVRILSTTPPRGGFLDDKRADTVRVGAFGYPLPDATLAIVDPETCTLVHDLVVGEIWVDSPCLSGGFWGLTTETEEIFHARCWGQHGALEMEFLRTGLLGFIYAGKVYVLGLYEDRLRQRKEWEGSKSPSITESDLIYTNRQFRYHYTAHLVQTIMQSIPFVFDSSAFDVFVNNEYLPVVLLESSLANTAPETPTGPPVVLDHDALQDMATKCMAILAQVHNVRVYCVLITAPNTLPRTIRNGRSEVGTRLCRKEFQTGSLPCVYVKFGVDKAVVNTAIDQVSEAEGGIWSVASSRYRDELLVHEDKQYSGVDERDEVMDDRTGSLLSKFTSIFDILAWRVACQPEELSYCSIDSKSRESKSMSWKKFDGKVAAVASMLMTKAKLKAGDVVVLIYTHGEDFVHAVHACLALGIIAIPLAPLDTSRLNEDVPALLHVIEDYNVKAILVNTDTDHAMKGKVISQHIRQSLHVVNATMPPSYNTMKPGRVSGGCKDLKIKMQAQWIAPGRPAIVWLYWTADHRRVAVQLGHDTILDMCKIQKETCQMTHAKPVIGCVRSTVGLGFLHTCFMGIYVGASTYLISPVDFAANPHLLFLTLSRYKVKDTYATPQMLRHAIAVMAPKGYNLRETRNLMITFDGRPQLDLFGKLRVHFAACGLDGTAINTAYSHMFNPMITTRSYMCIEPVELKLDVRELRRGFITVTSAEHGVSTLTLQDSGMVPVSTHVAIVHPETRRLCHLSEYGEIWVSSGGNAAGLYKSKDPFDAKRFQATTVDVDAGMLPVTYVRTGDLGFLRTVTRPVGPGGSMVEIQVLFVLGAIGDTFEVGGLNHFPFDIERTIERSHRAVCAGGSAVFQAGGLVVAVIEVSQGSSATAAAAAAAAAASQSPQAQGPRPPYLASLVPVLTNAVLNEHQIVVDIFAFVARGDFPRSRLQEKQRGKILAAWVMRKLKVLEQFVVSA